MPDRKDAKNDSTRQRIMLEAGPIFASKGFRATTVREICDLASVNLASINYYFGDKRQLYNETVVLARQMRVQQVPQPTFDQATAPEDKLRAFVDMLLKRLVAMQSEPWQVRLLMREILQPSDACRHLIKEYFQPFFKMLLEIVDDIVETRLPDHQRNQVGFSIIGQCLYYRFAADTTSMIIGESEFDENYDQEHLANHISEFSLGAIAAIKQKANINTSGET